MHTAAWATGRKFVGSLTTGHGFALSVTAMGCLFGAVLLLAQSASNPDDANSTTDSAVQGRDTPARHIQRLGDVVGATEWEPQLTVPGRAGVLPVAVHLTHEQQQQQLLAILDRLADSPGDPAAQHDLNLLLEDVVRQANAAIDALQIDQAEQLLGVVQAINPAHQGLQATRDRVVRAGEVGGQLAAARKALDEGRVYQPDNHSAWFYYRQVLDQSPDNEEAQQGLITVQGHMLAKAMDFAQQLDFDSADRLLEESAFVLQDQRQIEQSRLEIAQIRSKRAEQLESEAVAAMDRGEFARAERLMVDLVALGDQQSTINQLRRRLEEARIYGGFEPGQSIRDHFLTQALWAPESLVILAGSFMMGSTAFEAGREENEGPQHRVTFRRGFAIGLSEVSVAQFRVFVGHSGYKTDAERSGESTIYDHSSGRLTKKRGMHWEFDYEGRQAKPDDPVVHVSWNDAQAYLAWLAKGTAKPYRLPSEAEFEYALRGGRSTRFWWGDGAPTRVVENITGDGDTSRSRRLWTVAFKGYTDKFWGPAPLGSFEKNPFGLLDIGGNVGEWTRDCWHDTYVRAPADGSAWINPGCSLRVIRGGHWASSPEQTRSAFRLSAKPDQHDARIGFRIARDL